MSVQQIAIEKWEKEAQTVSKVGLGKAGFMGLWGSHNMRTDQGFKMGINVGDNTWRNARQPDQLTTTYAGAATLGDVLKNSSAKNANLNCMGWRDITDVEVYGDRGFERFTLSDYKWMSYKQVQDKVNAFGAGLAKLGMEKGQNITIYADTSKEWQMAAQACFRRGYPVATVYANLGAEALAYGLNQTEVTHVITDAALVPVIGGILDELPNITHIIFTKDPRPAGQGGAKTNEQVIKGIKKEGVKVMSWDDVVDLGQANKDQPVDGPGAEDTSVIMYTSGSTGMPKGVVLTHANLLAALAGLEQAVPGLGPEDTFIAYLPLAHILALVAECTVLAAGGAVGYGSTKTITDNSVGINKATTKGDAPTLAPTVMAAVPAIMDKIRAGVTGVVDKKGGFTKKLFDRAYKVKDGGQHGKTFYDWLVFDKLRTTLLGGRLRMLLSGGGPLSMETQKFMNNVFCCPVGQGYGLTETCGAATVLWPNDTSFGRVGAPVTCAQIKLVPWEDASYYPTDKPNPRGEILIAGGHIAKGYYKNQEKTDEDFKTDANGVRWFSTGDIGEMHPDGVLQIIDRKKDLVKNQGGEYVSYGKIEPVLKDCELIDNVMVYQDPLQGYAVALVTAETQPSLPDAAEVVKAFAAIGKAKKLTKFEIPTKVYVCKDAWTPENDMTTAALKLKRNSIVSHYKSQIDSMYA